MSIVKDLSLSPSGLQKIQWVRDFMPALGGIEERFRREKPFEGLTWGWCSGRGAPRCISPAATPCPPRTMWPLPWPAWGWRPSVSTGWTCGAMRTC